MQAETATPIVLDSLILLDFVSICRTELLGQLGTSVVVSDQVLYEIMLRDQGKRVKNAAKEGILDLQSIHDPLEVSLFSELRAGGRLAADECAVLAVAITRNWVAGLEDERARDEGKSRDGDLVFCQTEDLILRLMNGGFLTIEEANEFQVREGFGKT